MKLNEEQITLAKKLDKLFDAAWKKHGDELAKLTQSAWKGEKSLAGVQSAKWFQKSNNIGPKLAAMQTARTKFGGQVNEPNYNGLVKSLKELGAALTAFETNRKGSDATKDAKIKGVVKDYQDAVDQGRTWLEEPKQLLIAVYRGNLEGGSIVDALDPAG